MLRIIIFAETKQRGIEKLDSIVKGLNPDDILRYSKSINSAFVELKDGTYYKVATASDSSRGNKADKVYVEKYISNDILNCIIKPCLIPSTLPEEERIEFY